MEEFTTQGPAGPDSATPGAEVRRVTLQPLHDDVAPEDESDGQIAAHHANAPAIGNIASDREQTGTATTPPSQPQTAEQRAAELMANHRMAQPADTGKQRAKLVAIIGIVVIIAIAVFALLYRP